MLSQKAKYALRALTFLARRPSGSRASVAQIAQHQAAPHKYLEAVLLELRNGGFLRSERGRGGGYALAREPDQIILGDVIRCLDGPLALIPCASRSGYRRCEDCPDEARCALRSLMRRVRDAMSGVLDAATLGDLDRLGQAELSAVDYSI